MDNTATNRILLGSSAVKSGLASRTNLQKNIFCLLRSKIAANGYCVVDVDVVPVPLAGLDQLAKIHQTQSFPSVVSSPYLRYLIVTSTILEIKLSLNPQIWRCRGFKPRRKEDPSHGEILFPPICYKEADWLCTNPVSWPREK